MPAAGRGPVVIESVAAKHFFLWWMEPMEFYTRLRCKYDTGHGSLSLLEFLFGHRRAAVTWSTCDLPCDWTGTGEMFALKSLIFFGGGGRRGIQGWLGSEGEGVRMGRPLSEYDDDDKGCSFSTKRSLSCA